MKNRSICVTNVYFILATSLRKVSVISLFPQLTELFLSRFLDIHLSKLLQEPNTEPEKYKYIFEVRTVDGAPSHSCLIFITARH